MYVLPLLVLSLSLAVSATPARALNTYYVFDGNTLTTVHDDPNRITVEGLCTRVRWLYMLWRVRTSLAKQPCGSGRGMEPERCGRRCRGEYRTPHAVCGAD